MRRAARDGGFTLIELLVALAALAALAAISLRGLGSILETEAHLEAQARRWNDVSLLLAQMGRDLSLAVSRPARDGSGAVRPALAVGGEQLVLTRLGDDEGSAEDGLRRVGYRLREGTLEYLAWPAADAAPAAVPAASAVLEDVAEFRLRALDASGAALAVWPGGAGPDTLPRAIEAQIVLADGARITRLFLVR